jgi:hypothetical protein
MVEAVCGKSVRLVILTWMPSNAPTELSRAIETLYRAESGRVLATLLRLLGDLDLAEEAMHEPAKPLLTPVSARQSNQRENSV